MSTAIITPHPHTRIEDGIALLVGTLLIAFGLLLVREGGVMTGGTAGIVLYLHYAFDYAFGATFFVLNLPFYYLALRRMGWAFTLKTFTAIGLVSLFSDQEKAFIALQHIQPLYAAIIGNIILGVGFLILFRHRASLGGINILALFLQARFGWRAGWLQMGSDVLILLLSLTIVSLPLLAVSVLGAIVINLIIALNHRSGRYHA
ncbi:YitT family protein [Pseudomonas luteola]|uniref:YitT family protein n=1 Tax=Pseudomonas luteola TaxID=47886 RepID=UPI000F771136|nr:YitT family protein [Pseudomonas luteola]RRW40407.1 YitT family protein [Pseudomonas luteola]